MSVVSVIIPNYNHAAYLDQRINSVLSQTLPDLEIIILDDCSTDNSREIIEKYRGHPKVSTIVYNEVNSGNTFKQWLKGIEYCQSEFIWLAESDDWCEPSFLENIVTGMASDENCVVGFCQSYCIRETNKIEWKSNVSKLSQYINGKQFVNDNMLPMTAIFNASMAVWRKSYYANISNDFVNFRSCGDWLFWIELCVQGRVFISGKSLNYFRKHALNVSTTIYESGENFLEQLKMFELVLRKGLIGETRYVEVLKHHYLHYQAVKNKLSSEKNAQIRQSFFLHKSSRVALRKHYLDFYSKHTIKNLLKKAFQIIEERQ